MAVSIQTKTQITSAAGTLTLDKPSGTVENDLLIAHIAFSFSSITVSAPAGWTQVYQTAATTGPKAAIFRKTAGSSEGTTYQFTFTGGEPASIGNMIRISGHDVLNPISASSEKVNDTASTTLSANTITPEADCLILFFGATTGAAFSTYALTTSSPTFTEQYDLEYVGQVSACLASGVRPESTATGGATATMGGSARSVGHLLAIAPQPDITVSMPKGTLNLTAPFFPTAIQKVARLEISTKTPNVEEWSRPSKSTGSWTNQSKS